MKMIHLSKLKSELIRIKEFNQKKEIIAVFVLFIFGGGIAVHSILKPSMSVVSDYIELTKKDLCNSIDTTATIESDTKSNVYSTLNNTIKEIMVEPGDTVNEGDVLCVLDSSTLEQDIKDANELINLEKSKAQVNVDSKKQAYDDMLYLYDNNMNSEIKNSEDALNKAQKKLEDAQNNYNNKKKQFDNGTTTQSELDDAQGDLDSAQSNYEKSQSDVERAKVKAKQQLDIAKKEYEAAIVDYNNNKNEITLQRKQDDLNKCIITAPASGTVTTINATVGNQANGILFVIEDLSDPIVKAEIKEADFNKVKIGQEAEITTDLSVDNDYATGTIINITDKIKDSSKTTNSNNNNNSNSNNSNNSVTISSYEAKIKLDNPEDCDFIKVGTKAKAKIILDKKEDVFAVPLSSIIDENGRKFIYILKENDDGQTYTVTKIEVTTGMETDSSVEIESSTLDSGDKIITEPTSHKNNEVVQLTSSIEDND